MDSEENSKVTLTPRENDVMGCLCRGKLYKEIADELGISYSAVHKHQHSIYRKLQAGNRTEALINWSVLGTHDPEGGV
jgi:DNA-binding NarL/FixJ family response regulator